MTRPLATGSDPFDSRARLPSAIARWSSTASIEAVPMTLVADAGDGQDPARERAPTCRRWCRHRGRRPGAGGLAAGGAGITAELPFLPARVILQDFTGVPAVVDLAAMRDAMAALGGDPARINPLVPADLVIDHSVQVDRFGSDDAFAFNVAREYERNGERYQLLRWAQTAFSDLRVVPPGTGIVHQVNLEYLARRRPGTRRRER